MKDKVARKVVEMLAEKLGCEVAYYESVPPMVYDKGDDGEFSIPSRLQVLEREFAALKESAKPVCKTCGQKIQEGFKAGQIETLAADVRRKK